MYMVMIAVHKDASNNIIGFRIIDTETNKTKDVAYEQVKTILSQGEHSIENLKIENGSLQGSNGALSRFPVLVGGRVIGESPLIILEELVDNRYRVTNSAGQVVDITEEQAINYSNKYAIANGKIVTDSDTGKQHISSINGTYKQNKSIKDRKAGEKLAFKMGVVGEDRYGIDDKQFAYAKDKKITELRLGRGVVGIKPQGFKGCTDMTSIEFPDSLKILGDGAFIDCGIENIELPEGIEEIPTMCFHNNRDLRVVKLPNTLRKIKDRAFTGCKNLAVIYAGPEEIDIAFGAVPTGVRWVRRNVKTGATDNDIEATMIAVKYNGNIPVQYRIFDANAKGNNKIMDIPSNVLIQALADDKIQISNLIEKDGSLVCTNGKFEGYPAIDMNNTLLNGDVAPFVVVNKLGDKGYTIADLNGKTLKLTTSNAVKLAKSVGVANGRIVTVDGVEIISTLGDSYKIKELASSKLGDTSDDLDINIGIKSRSKDFKGRATVDVSVEINENDVFAVMTNEQKRILKNYYVQYTLDLYHKMAKSVRLCLMPGKAERLSQLRGELEWEFAGVWDSGFLGASHCELGHALRYEYYAVPTTVGLQRRSRRLNKQSYGEIDAIDTKIVFGETCASDFFNISEENMKQLVKTRKTMSDEIKLMSDIITNNQEKEYVNKLMLLYMIIKKLNTGDNIKEAFGEDLGDTLMNFIRTEMPFPKTLVIECSRRANEDPKKFFTVVFPEHASLLDRIYTEKNSSLHETAKVYLNFIADNKIEGEYAYNPLIDAADNKRRDVGKYNKDTRTNRMYFDSFISSYLMSRDYSYEELENVLNLITKLEQINEKIHRVANANTDVKRDIENINIHAYNYVHKGNMDDSVHIQVRTTLLNALMMDNRYKVDYSYKYSSLYTYARSSHIVSRYNNTPYRFVLRDNRLYKHKYVKNAMAEINETINYGLDKAIQEFMVFITSEISEEQERLIREAEERKRIELEEQERRAREEQERLERKRIEEERRQAELESKQRELESDKVYMLKKLMEKHADYTEKSTDYGIKVAKDIVGRGTAYKNLSSKQKWRIDTELKKYEALDNGEIIENKVEETKETEVNNTYMLEGHPEIKSKVELVQSKADSVEMQAVLKETPNVLKICYSIMRYGKASDKQLKHVYKALEILEKI